ncbi:hypothetical protein BFW87_27680 [Pseudomonas fluorescens]|uniref:ImpA N-terminal domain-containing protein n=1 Tax=Pseudomonas fluorescens TaxID=294 RepID=A0A1T2XZG1_PSEFL|nr:hypothetical protein BFW87_27680 [Pseudomonas fluorescens]
MSYSEKLYAYYFELARLPCTSGEFAGCDMRFSSEYEALESELGKAQSIHGASLPDWKNVSEMGERLLRDHSKDLRVPASIRPTHRWACFCWWAPVG